jgi:phosphate transport system protein
MERHFEKSLEELLAVLSQMAAHVDGVLECAEESLNNHDASQAEGVFIGEKEIDLDQNKLDEMILDFIALNQPVAGDLRQVLSAQDVVVDLERIGDHAVNIAESSVRLSGLRTPPDLLKLPEMAILARSMVADSVKSFLVRDPDLARRTIARDDRMDALNREMTRMVIAAIKEDRELVETGLELIRISKNLERMADLSANIAEDTVFLVEARTARHQAM